MKLSINISEDKELRQFTKDQIKGQFKALVRKEVRLLIKDEVERLVNTISKTSIIREVRSIITPNISSEMRIALKGQLTRIALEKLNKSGLLAEPVIKSLIKTEVNRVAKNLMKNLQ